MSGNSGQRFHESEWYRYLAVPLNVVDGDTIDMQVDFGFKTFHNVRLRLAYVDTAEIHGVKRESDEFARGQEHKEFVSAWLQEGASTEYDWPLVVATDRDRTGKYGRYVAIVERRNDGALLNDDLIAEYPEVEYE